MEGGGRWGSGKDGKLAERKEMDGERGKGENRKNMNGERREGEKKKNRRSKHPQNAQPAGGFSPAGEWTNSGSLPLLIPGPPSLYLI